MRLFTDVLREHRGGKLVEHLSEKLADVVSAAKATKKKGKIKLELTIVPDGDDGFEITPNVSVMRPEKDLQKAQFFGNDAGELFRDSPSRPSMFKGVDLGTKPGTEGEGRHDGTSG